MVTDELISRENFMEIFSRALDRLTQRVGCSMPLDEFTTAEIYMVGLASTFGLVVIDNTLSVKPWIRLTPAGERWLKEQTSLEEMEARAPQVIERREMGGV